jgi:hypothetical protein
VNVSIQYLAGFFDGEGCITMSKKPSGSMRIRGQVAQKISESHILSEFSSRWGGSFTKFPGTNQPVVGWYVDSDELVKFLYEISPFLIIKKPQADLAIEFMTQYRGYRGGKIGSSPFTPYAKAKREEIFQKMRLLKTNGNSIK